ncbi:hypothetical protein [Kribbella sp.]|uniref:hypothetical protein n=1 Tax=Kribbella sp. TaxID=1871183 RepID=UPI002D65A348|nr:hypothetical protein [Kribbella sp.]HZX06908.1 hypothetical protein [Kribbella sp.]
MSWQLWVVIAVAAAGLILLAVARMRHARKVFADITEPDRPESGRSESGRSESGRSESGRPEPDELARARARHLPHNPAHRRSHG